jgi:hypothetical protein
MEGSRLRVASCLLLPAVQLVVGISHPSWVSLPFFIGSCVGLVDWSLTSNFLGLFRYFLYKFIVYWPIVLLFLSLSLIVLHLVLKVVETSSAICRLQNCPAVCVSAPYCVPKYVSTDS